MFNRIQVRNFNSLRSAFVLSVLLFSLFNLNAQVNVRTQLDTNYMLIGDQLRMKVEVNSSSELKSAKALVEQIDTSGNIEFLSETEWQKTTNGLQKIYTLTSFDSAYYNLMPLKVVYQTVYKSDTAYSNSLGFMVDNPKIDSTMADIKPIIEEPTKLEDFYPLFALLGVLALFGFLAWYFIVRKKNEELQEEVPVVIRPAHEVALEKLSGLKTAQLWQKGEIKEYYSKLTFIFREYLENRFDIQALESTSEEILGQLRKRDFDAKMNNEVSRVLESADLVKFAKARPTSEIHEESFEKLTSFVQKTKLVNLQEEDGN